MTKVQRCMKCNRRYRGQLDWNTVYVGGRAQGVLCSDCQTPEEAEEAVHNLATGVTESMQEATIARVIDTATLAAANDYAVERCEDDGDWGAALTDEGVEGLSSGERHVCVPTGYQHLPDWMLVMVVFNCDVDKGHLATTEGDAVRAGFLQVRPAEWMAWGDDLPVLGRELSERATSGAREWLGHTDGGAE